MLNLSGKNAIAKVFTNNVDQETIYQIIQMLNEPITEQTIVRIMPDTHYGKGATIGTTIKLSENRKAWKVSPSIVGVDMSCGMMSIRIAETDIDLNKLDRVINELVPAGMCSHASPLALHEVQTLYQSLSFNIQHKERHLNNLGTLGGGNHFIELAKDEQERYWLTVHSGSRSFGATIAKHHERIAQRYHQNSRDEVKSLIEELKLQGRQQDIQTILQSFKSVKPQISIPYLERNELDNYLNDSHLAAKYAELSREYMLKRIAKAMGWKIEHQFDSVHNNIDFEHGIIRKGATSARLNEQLIIPLNMRDGSLICIGKGNDDWNQSAPHGAGRVLSRSAARHKINLDDYKKQMLGIYTTSLGVSTLDEAPDVYKPAQEIVELITDTVDIVHWIKPVYNFKAH